MSDQSVFTKCKAEEIRSELYQIYGKKLKNSTKRKFALRKIVANLSMGSYQEMIELFPEIMKIWSEENDLETKRVFHLFLVTINSAKPSMLKKLLPLLIKDLNSDNETLKIMTIRSLSSISMKEYIYTSFKYIKSILSQDNSSILLSKAAIYALIRLDQEDHSYTMEFVPILFEIIDQNKREPTILVAALQCLYTIHERNHDVDSLKIAPSMCFTMLEILPKLNEWDTSLVLDCLTVSFAPETHEQAADIIEMVLPQLQHLNTSVVLNCLKFIMYLINYVDYIEEKLIKRFSNSVVSLLNKESELQFLVLRNVILLLLCRNSPLLKVDVSYFFIQFNDPIYVKDTKLEILYLLANQENLPRILNELKEYSTDIDIQMSKKAIRAIGNLAIKIETCHKNSVHVLLELLDFGVDYIIQEIISVFKNILRKYPYDFENVVPILVKYIDSIQDPESKSSMIWIVTQYSKYLPNYLTIFQKLFCNFKDELLEVQFSILNAVVKFFTRSPSLETETLCIKILKCATEEIDNPDLRDRGFMYWRLLSSAHQLNDPLISMDTVKDIIDGELPLIMLNTKLDPVVMEELELSIGSIASIYLKPISQVFRLNKPRFLRKTPALINNRDDLNIILDRVHTNNDTTRNENRPLTSSSLSSVKKIDDYDKPAEKVNQLKSRRSILLNNKLSRKPSLLARQLSIRKPF